MDFDSLGLHQGMENSIFAEQLMLVKWLWITLREKLNVCIQEKKNRVEQKTPYTKVVSLSAECGFETEPQRHFNSEFLLPIGRGMTCNVILRRFDTRLAVVIDKLKHTHQLLGHFGYLMDSNPLNACQDIFRGRRRPENGFHYFGINISPAATSRHFPQP